MSEIPEELRGGDEVAEFPQGTAVPHRKTQPRTGVGGGLPRPPRVEPVEAEIRVEFNGRLIAASTRTQRVLETSSPPVYYIPPEDVRRDLLVTAEQTALCEWKGISQYWHIVVGGKRAENAAWHYPDPWPGFGAIAGYFAFIADKMDGCFVDGEREMPQPGEYYGGWITVNITGPFKGGPGTERW